MKIGEKVIISTHSNDCKRVPGVILSEPNEEMGADRYYVEVLNPPANFKSIRMWVNQTFLSPISVT